MLLAERQNPRVLLCLSFGFKFQPLWEEICSDFVSELIREVSHFLPGTCICFSGCSIQGDLPVSAGRIQSVVTNEAEKERSRDFDCADAKKLVFSGASLRWRRTWASMTFVLGSVQN